MARLADLLNARILTIDIERLPGLAPVWDQKTRFIPVSTWRRLPSLLCFAAKWYRDRSIQFEAVWGDGGHEAMIRRSWDLYDQADVVVTYNGVKFDTPHLRSDWAVLGLPQPSSFKQVDLYQVNRRQLGFESKSLQHLCDRLGLPGKSGKYDLEGAEAAYNGDVKAQRRLERYNRGDVRITEQCYDALRPWITNHPHVASSATRLTCNRCGSTNLDGVGSYLAVVHEYSEYRCRNCGGIVRAGHVWRVARTRGVQ